MDNDIRGITRMKRITFLILFWMMSLFHGCEPVFAQGTTVQSFKSPLAIIYGGTGKTTVTANSYLKGNGGSALVERTYSEVRTDLGLATGDSPTFAGLTLTAFSGFVKATAGILSAAALSDADIPNDITLTNITQITNRSHTSLSDIGTLTHSTIDGYLDQSVKQAASPIFATAKLSGLTDGYIPKHTSDATGLENSPIYTDGTKVGIGTTVLLGQFHTHGANNTINALVTGTALTVPGNYTGLWMGYPADGYIKSGIFFEGTDGNARGKMHFALNSTAGVANAVLADAKMTINYNGNVGIGTTTPVSTFQVNGGVYVGAETTFDSDITSQFGAPKFVLVDNNSANFSNVSIGNTNNAYGAYFIGAKTRSTTANANTIVAQHDSLMVLSAWGADGATYRNAAQIGMYSDGTPGLSDMPGRIVFFTTPDGSATLSERMRITNGGMVGIGTTVPSERLDVKGNIKYSGTTGGLVHKTAEVVCTIAAAASCVTTFDIPAGVRLLGGQLRVDTALTAGETWNAAFSGGSTTTLCHEQAVAKDTKCNLLIVDEIATGTTNVTITPHAGGSFTAAGVIRIIAYYEVLEVMANAP
jgi:hypothetical protein